MKNLLIVIQLTVSALLATPLYSSNVSGSVKNALTPLCNDGAINLTISGGAPPYTFNWTGPNGFFSTQEDLDNLGIGSYYVTVTDGMCGTAICTYEVKSDTKVKETHAIDCNEESYIELQVPEGSYTYSWAGPNNFTATTQDVHNLSNAGAYQVTISSPSGCSVVLSAIINTISTPPLIFVTPTCMCPGGQGALDVQVTGGSGNYAYAWSGPGLPPKPNVQNPIVTSIGNYSVTVTDSQTGCETTGQTTVSVCNVDLSSAVKVTPDCNSDGTSTISIQLPNGYGFGKKQFKWIRLGFGVVKTDLTKGSYSALSGAIPGEYCLSLWTENGCSEQFCGIIVVAQPKPTIIASATPPTTGSNGAIALNVTGQPGPFTYLWNNGAITKDITNLIPGQYCVTVTDNGSGCTSTKCINLLSCSGLQQAIGTIQASVTAMLSGGTGGAIHINNVQDQFPEYKFIFNWSNLATTQDISGLSPGFYTVSITTPNCPGFTLTGTWEICSFSLGFLQQPIDCKTTKLTAAPSPPSGSYNFHWSTGVNTSFIYASLGVEYCVTVTIGNGTSACSASSCVTLKPSPVTVALVNFSNSTYGNKDGYITVQGGSKNLPLTYKWSNGGNTPTIINLGPGTYTVTVTDACSNTATLSHTIQCEFGPSDLQANVQNVSCNSNTLGAITLTQLPDIGGADPVFNFNWSNGATTQDITDLTAGQYCVTVTELTTGCYAVDCFEVASSGAGNFTVALSPQPGCWPLSEGSITAVPSKPNQGPFSYSWTTWGWANPAPDLSTTDATINNLPAGWYTVVATNALGCTASNSIILWPKSSFIATALNPVVVCKGQTGIGSIATQYGVGPFTYTWANYSVYPVTPFTTTSQFQSGLQPGNWFVTVTDTHSGCQSITNFSVRESIVKMTGTVHARCDLNGYIDITPFTGAGSNPPFKYKWNDGATTEDKTNILPISSSYSVTLTDKIGCTAKQNFYVPAVSKILSGSQIMNAHCDPSPVCDGSIDITVDIVPGTTSYAWSNGAHTQDASNLCAGFHYLTITSPNCVEQHFFYVEDHGAPSCASPLYGLDDDNYFYNLFFGQLEAEEIDCFDPKCQGFDHHCSKLHVHTSGTVKKGCWEGKITIDPTIDGIPGAPLDFRVEKDPSSTTTDKLIKLSNNSQTYDIPKAGTYEVKVTYTGEGESQGNDRVCSYFLNWYGDGNSTDAIGFAYGLWFDVGSIDPIWKNAYYAAWTCGTCKSEPKYLLDNDDHDCHDFESILSTFFNYKPNDYNHPCQGGGELTKIDFDAGGHAVIQKINVLPNIFIAELSGMQPFGLGPDTWCEQSGWCLFPQDAIYPTANLNRPILATWAVSESCEPLPPTGGNNPPCSEANCPPPLICHNGICVTPCNNGVCLYGECIDGICVEATENECHPDCPEGYECHEGDCYLDESICNFKASVNGGGGVSTYKFWHPNIPPGTTLTIEYITYTLEDMIAINGVNVVPCVATGTQYYSATFPTAGNSTTIVVTSCGSEISKFGFKIHCPPTLEGDGPSSKAIQSPRTEANAETLVHPNPFANSLDVTVRNVDEPFLGVVQLLDNFGKKIASREMNFELGNNSTAFDSLDGLATGIYFIVIQKDGGVYSSKKVVKIE